MLTCFAGYQFTYKLIWAVMFCFFILLYKFTVFWKVNGRVMGNPDKFLNLEVYGKYS